MTYDGFDRLISTEDPMGRSVQKHYDALGHVTDIISPIGDKTHNVYDLTGHVIQHLGYACKRRDNICWHQQVLMQQVKNYGQPKKMVKNHLSL